MARRDKVEPNDLRTLAQAVLRHDGVRAVVLGGLARRDQGGDRRRDRRDARRHAARAARSGPMVGGGGGGSPEVALAGGKDPSQIEAALAEAQRLLSA